MLISKLLANPTEFNFDAERWKEIRSRLPGFERDEILMSEGTGSEKKQLIYKYRIAGCLDNFIDNHCYWVVKGDRTDTYATLDEAAIEYCSYCGTYKSF